MSKVWEHDNSKFSGLEMAICIVDTVRPDKPEKIKARNAFEAGFKSAQYQIKQRLRELQSEELKRRFMK